jgi:hypothetical protein
MSNWRFTLLDRLNIATVIEEPVGWDACEAALNRDKDYHGIFFDNQGDTFEFYDEAKDLLQAEYNSYGSQGNLVLIIEENCGNGYVEYSRGKFDFNKYEFICERSCFVKIPIESIGEVMDLRNRINQKVDLETLTGFDGTTALIPYSHLPFTMELPGKSINVQDKAIWEMEGTTEISLADVPNIQYDSAPSNYNFGWFQVVPQIETIKLSEFGKFSTALTPENNFICSGIYNDDKCPDLFKVRAGNIAGTTDRTLYFDWSNCTPTLYNDNNKDNFDFINKFNLSLSYTIQFDTKNARILFLNKVVLIRRKNGTTEVLHNIQELSATGGSGSPGGYVTGSYWAPNTTHTVSDIFTISDIMLNDGDYLFIVLCGLSQYLNTEATAGDPAFNLVGKAGTLDLLALSKAVATTSKVFAINETISRVSEAITNDKLRAYSEYFGRTDSQPYTVDADGNGSLEVVTDGIRVRRQENKIAGKTSVFAVSLQDLFEGLNPIHNIGMGIEADINRTGYNRLRVEPWTFFYNNAVIFTCTNIDKIIRKAEARDIFSTFQFGYQKWEAEEFNGLDEFLTKRTYRTTLSQIKNDLSKLSKMVASGYALEITRRKGNEDSKDWRYDKDTFIICCKRNTPVTRNADFINTDRFIVFEALPNQFIGQTITITGTASNNGSYTISDIQTISIVGQITPGYQIFVLPATLVYEVGGSGTFLLGGSTALIVEQGNISTPENIIDPATIYNYRISPVRNAMRWMNKVLASYRNFDADAKLLFTDGDGNYFAKGEMTATNGKLENAAIEENEMVNLSIYADKSNAMPLMMAERIQFEYPMTSSEYADIKANPYGLVSFSSDCEAGEGWIEAMIYKPEQGKATFTLIPKAN